MLKKMALGILLALAWAAGYAAQPSPPRPVPAQPGWVGLYNDEVLQWLENANRLDQLCPEQSSDRDAQLRCREDKLAPRRQRLLLRDGPSEQAAIVGTLMIEALPGEGLRAYYRAVRGRREQAFQPDLYEPDWGYGPYFHQTYLARRGDWFLLRIGRSDRPAWLDLGSFARPPALRLLQTGDIVRLGRDSYVVLGIEPGHLRVRPEQAADMWCKATKAPTLKRWKEQRLSFPRLYDRTGRLQTELKYRRGC